MNIQTVDDAKRGLQALYQAKGDWSQVENSFLVMAHGAADSSVADLLGWYGKDIGRIKYMTLAVGEGFTAASEIILRGQILWLLEILNEAYQEIVDENEQALIDEAQKDP